MIYLTIILGVLLIISGYIIFNLSKVSESQEDMILSQNKYIEQIDQAINFSEEKILEIDKKEIFKSDDEIGWFFDNLKQIQNYISSYKLIYK